MKRSTFERSLFLAFSLFICAFTVDVMAMNRDYEENNKEEKQVKKEENQLILFLKPSVEEKNLEKFEIALKSIELWGENGPEVLAYIAEHGSFDMLKFAYGHICGSLARNDLSEAQKGRLLYAAMNNKSDRDAMVKYLRDQKYNFIEDLDILSSILQYVLHYNNDNDLEYFEYLESLGVNFCISNKQSYNLCDFAVAYALAKKKPKYALYFYGKHHDCNVQNFLLVEDSFGSHIGSHINVLHPDNFEALESWISKEKIKDINQSEHNGLLIDMLDHFVRQDSSLEFIRKITILEKSGFKLQDAYCDNIVELKPKFAGGLFGGYPIEPSEEQKKTQFYANLGIKSPVMSTIKHGKLQTLIALIKHDDFDFNIVEEGERINYYLKQAIDVCQKLSNGGEIIKVLLEGGADPELNGVSCLAHAVKVHNYVRDCVDENTYFNSQNAADVIKQLIIYGSDLNGKDACGNGIVNNLDRRSGSGEVNYLPNDIKGFFESDFGKMIKLGIDISGKKPENKQKIYHPFENYLRANKDVIYPKQVKQDPYKYLESVLSTIKNPKKDGWQQHKHQIEAALGLHVVFGGTTSAWELGNKPAHKLDQETMIRTIVACAKVADSDTKLALVNLVNRAAKTYENDYAKRLHCFIAASAFELAYNKKHNTREIEYLTDAFNALKVAQGGHNLDFYKQKVMNKFGELINE